MPMSSEPALLRAVLDNPEDDVVRLIYADWCEEHGMAVRASLIRTQVEQARWCLSPHDNLFRAPCGLLIQELLPEHKEAFMAPLLALDLIPAQGGFSEHS